MKNAWKVCRHSAVYYIFNLCGVLCIFTPLLEISQGKLRGVHSRVSGQYKYYGIPYAASQRFQPPGPPPQWDGVFNAINPISTCPQAISFLVLGKEDCLHLDVHTPETTNSDMKLPVMVFFHGGAYYHGAKYHYGPEYLVNNDVIVVVINYRLGVLGFLCINGVANLGLKDQVAALRWVKQNIRPFGGDPDNVTLFGQSAGASAIGMHLIMEASRGLFHKAIMQSGSSLTPWAFNLIPKEAAIRDAEKLGANGRNIEGVFHTFANASLYNLMVATKDVSINSRYFKYSPCFEDKSFDEPLFSDTPYNLLKTGKFNQVPLIVGVTDMEGLLFYGLHNKITLRDMDENFLDKLPSVFQWCSEEERNAVSAKLRNHYFEANNIDRRAANNITNYYSDWIAYSTSSAFADVVKTSSSTPVYSYIFSYEGNLNIPKFLYGFDTKRGACHADDVFYLFKLLGLPTILSNADKLIKDRMVIMWTNFAKTGNPTPVTSRLLPVQWLPVTENNSKVLRIDRMMEMTDTPKEMTGKFFLDLLCEYGQEGFVPCDSKKNCNKRDFN